MQIAPSKLFQSNPFPRLLSKKCSRLTRFVGIDLGIDHARVVAFGQRHRDIRRDAQHDGTLRWLSKHHFSIPIDPLSAPPADWTEKTIATVVNKLPRCVDGEQTIAAISLPLPWVHYQVNDRSELDACQRQCDAMFTSSLFRSPAHLSYWPTNHDGQCMIAATAESAAFVLAQAVGALGFQVQCILPHGQVMIAAAKPMTGIEPSCVVSLNRGGGLIAMNNDGSCGLCRSLPAVESEVLAAAGPCPLTLDSIQSWLAEVSNEINATIRYAAKDQHHQHHQHHQRDQHDQPSHPVLICGDLAGIEDLDSALATLLNRPVAQWRYQGKFRPAVQSHNAASADVAKDDCEYALALSLSMAAAQQVVGGIR